MKKVVFLILILICPIIVYADDDSENFAIIDSITKYYKTTTFYSDNVILSADSNSILSYSEEISEEEYNNAELENIYDIDSSTSVETTYKKMTTTLSTNGSYYRYKVTLDWKNIPSVRSYDVIAIGHYASVKPVSSTIVFLQTYCTSSNSCTSSSSATINTSSTGTGATFKLPTGTYTSLTETLYFDVEKSTTYTVISQKAVGDYAHATQTVSKTSASLYNVSTSGITFTTTTISGYFDYITEATATWSGSW